MIIEAKRSDTTFVVPQGRYSDKPVSFALLAKECPDAEKAMHQALGYAAGLGARLIAITNGHQWLLTLTFVHNQCLTDRSVFVFESYEAIEERFRLFFDAFGPTGVESNECLHLLSAERHMPPPPKLSQRIHNYPAPADRNQIANELSAVLGAVWEEAKHDENQLYFLQECYVDPEASTSGMALAEELIGQRLSTDQRLFVESIDSNNAACLLHGESPEKPIVVVGNVGNGKTTFLKVLRQIRAKKSLKKYVQIDVDFVDRPDSPAEVADYIYECIERELRENHGIDIQDDKIVRAALNADLNRFKRTPEAKVYGVETREYQIEELKYIQRLRDDKHRYLQKVFADVRGARQFSVALFFDNLDRRSPEIQEQAYLKASAIARDWSALVFVCLRPTTFNHSKAFGVLDSVAPKIISVAPPSAEPLLVKRFKYAIKYAEGKRIPDRNGRSPLSSRFTMELPSVVQFLECLIKSFRRRRELVNLFDAISNGNAREVLISVYSFLTSLHLDTREILHQYQNDPSYLVPVHHALRSILFGNFMHFDPQKSQFVNLFDIQHSDRIEHFSRLSALAYLSSIPNGHPTYGFAQVSEICQHLQHSVYSSDHSTWTIEYLHARKCVEARDPVEKWSQGVQHVRITPLGKYHITELCSTFQYIDAMSVDTPVIDEDARASIRDVVKIEERLCRARVFLEYLSKCASQVQDSAARQIWAQSADAVSAEMRRIETTVKNRATTPT